MISSYYDVNVEVGDLLVLSSLCNTASVVLRMDAVQSSAQQGGQFITHTPLSTRVLSSSQMQLAAGPLFGVRVIATSGSPAMGSVWVRVDLARSVAGVLTSYRTLGMGFLNTNVPFNWPGPNTNLLPTDGAGQVRIIAASVPAAGAEVSETVPTGARWELRSFHARIVCDANAANRFPRLQFDDGANLFNESELNATAMTANQTVLITWAAASVNVTGQVGFRGNIPNAIRLSAGHRIKTTTLAIQVGDQWGQLFYEVLEWMTGD